MNPYTELGVDTDATEKVIKSAYRRLAMKLHPDRGGDEEKFKDVQLSYEILMDPERRKTFDDTGIVSNVPFEQLVRERVLRLFLELAQKHGWQQNDYIQGLRNGFNRSLKELKTKEDQLCIIRDRMDGMIPQTHKENHENMFVIAIRQQQAVIDRDLAKLGQEKQIGNRAIELLEPYKDNMPAQQFVQSFYFTTSSSTTGTGNW